MTNRSSFTAAHTKSLSVAELADIVTKEPARATVAMRELVRRFHQYGTSNTAASINARQQLADALGQIALAGIAQRDERLATRYYFLNPNVLDDRFKVNDLEARFMFMHCSFGRSAAEMLVRMIKEVSRDFSIDATRHYCGVMVSGTTVQADWAMKAIGSTGVGKALANLMRSKHLYVFVSEFLDEHTVA